MTRELDAEVAEKVMGWKPLEDSAMYPNHGWAGSDGLFLCHAFDFEPSTDIAAAFQVVEKMRERGYEFSLDSNTAGDKQDGEPLWIASVGKWSRMGQTPSEAICRAALAAQHGKEKA